MFSTEWEGIYSRGEQLAVWPWSDVVSLTHRFCKSLLGKNAKILEVGCGAGANIPFFLKNKFEYFGIDGSESIINYVRTTFPFLKAKLQIGDFANGLSYESAFDLVLDRASITHNDLESIQIILRSVYNSLKPGGIFLGIDWFSISHSDFSSGKIKGDPNTKNEIGGQFRGVGTVHFSDENHLRDLFSKFDILLLEEKIIRRFEPVGSDQFGSWNIVARRPHV